MQSLEGILNRATRLRRKLLIVVTRKLVFLSRMSARIGAWNGRSICRRVNPDIVLIRQFWCWLARWLRRSIVRIWILRVGWNTLVLVAGIAIVRRGVWVIRSRIVIGSVWIVIGRWTPPRPISKPVRVSSPERTKPKAEAKMEANSGTINGMAPIAAVPTVEASMISTVKSAVINGDTTTMKASTCAEAVLRKANLRGGGQGQRNGGKRDSS